MAANSTTMLMHAGPRPANAACTADLSAPTPPYVEAPAAEADGYRVVSGVGQFSAGEPARGEEDPEGMRYTRVDQLTDGELPA